MSACGLAQRGMCSDLCRHFLPSLHFSLLCRGLGAPNTIRSKAENKKNDPVFFIVRVYVSYYNGMLCSYLQDKVFLKE